MSTYKAMYKFLDKGVHAEVLDFPGAISFGADLDEARRMLASALVDMAETNLLGGEALPPRRIWRSRFTCHLEIPDYTAARICQQLGILLLDRSGV
jgi:predicted RNase H-like HicB family nuclease